MKLTKQPTICKIKKMLHSMLWILLLLILKTKSKACCGYDKSKLLYKIQNNLDEIIFEKKYNKYNILDIALKNGITVYYKSISNNNSNYIYLVSSRPGGFSKYLTSKDPHILKIKTKIEKNNFIILKKISINNRSSLKSFISFYEEGFCAIIHIKDFEKVLSEIVKFSCKNSEFYSSFNNLFAMNFSFVGKIESTKFKNLINNYIGKLKTDFVEIKYPNLSLIKQSVNNINGFHPTLQDEKIPVLKFSIFKLSKKSFDDFDYIDILHYSWINKLKIEDLPTTSKNINDFWKIL